MSSGSTSKVVGSFLVFILYPILAALTLFTTYPFSARATHRYIIGQHRFGTANFGFDSPIGPFYKAFLFAIGWSALILVVGFFALGGTQLLYTLAMSQQPGGQPDPAFIWSIVLFYVVLLVAILPAGFIYQAYLRNAVYAQATLEGGHRFHSSLSPVKLMWIALSNAVVVACTLGLMLPWAKIRMARYLADHTQVHAAGSLDEFVGQESEKVSALGDAYTDIEGIDLGVAI